MGRRIRFLFMLMGSGDATPELVGYSISYLSRDDDAESWTAAIKIADKSVDLCGHPEDYNAKELSDILNYWSRTVRPLTMRSIYAIWIIGRY
jgi:hypothetical protein